MQILVLGGGKVGATIAEILCTHRHNVTIVEKDPVKARQLDDALLELRRGLEQRYATADLDFYLEPLRDTVPSLRTLGILIGQQEQTERLIAFYEGRMKRIASRVAGCA